MSSTPATLSGSELRTVLRQYRADNWQGIQTPEWQEKVVDDTLEDDGETVLRAIEEFWELRSNARVLDIGSGVGNFVLACRRRGLMAFGIEPDRIGWGGRLSSIQIAIRRVAAPSFVAGLGEKLPFAEGSFDLVTMNQVMEHVADQKAVLQEALRVLREGGAVYIACPNYLRFYEPHYKIWWFPLLPKWLGRWYLKLLSRSPVLLEQLTYTTNARLRALAGGLGPEFTVLDLHRERFLKKCQQAAFVSRRARLVGRLCHLPLLGPLALRLALLLLQVMEAGCQMLILRRPGNSPTSC